MGIVGATGQRKLCKLIYEVAGLISLEFATHGHTCGHCISRKDEDLQGDAIREVDDSDPPHACDCKGSLQIQ